MSVKLLAAVLTDVIDPPTLFTLVTLVATVSKLLITLGTARVFMSATTSAVPNVFKSDTTSVVASIAISATTSVVPSIDKSSTASGVPSKPISVALLATVVTSVAFGTYL